MSLWAAFIFDLQNMVVLSDMDRLNIHGDERMQPDLKLSKSLFHDQISTNYDDIPTGLISKC